MTLLRRSPSTDAPTKPLVGREERLHRLSLRLVRQQKRLFHAKVWLDRDEVCVFRRKKSLSRSRVSLRFEEEPHGITSERLCRDSQRLLLERKRHSFESKPLSLESMTLSFKSKPISLESMTLPFKSKPLSLESMTLSFERERLLSRTRVDDGPRSEASTMGAHGRALGAPGSSVPAAPQVRRDSRDTPFSGSGPTLAINAGREPSQCIVAPHLVPFRGRAPFPASLRRDASGPRPAAADRHRASTVRANLARTVRHGTRPCTP
jgi:hypothetical protein